MLHTDPQRQNKQFELLQEHKLLGHQFQSATKDKRLHQAYKTNLHRNTLLFSEFEKMSDSLAKQNIEVIALKGISLLTSIYREDWGIRSMSDIDVLVDPRHRRSVRHWLFDRGYSQEHENQFFANAHKEIWRKSIAGMDVVFELHFRLFAGSQIEVLSETSSMGVKILEPHTEFTYLVAHLAHQHTFLKLFWLYDIDLFTKHHSLNWDTILNLSRGLRINRALDATFYVLKEHLQNTHVPESRSTVWPHLIDWKQMTQARNRPIHYFLLKHLLKDGPIEALRYDIAWLNNRLKK